MKRILKWLVIFMVLGGVIFALVYSEFVKDYLNRERESIVFGGTVKGENYRDITFKYNNSNAGEVFVSGEFNDWSLEPMAKNGSGVWMLKKTLPEKVDFAYKFVADGAWVMDPDNPKVIARGFKGESSFLAIGIKDIYDKTQAAVTSNYVYGKVTNSSGERVYDSTVKISMNDTEKGRAFSDWDGNYRSRELPLGSYSVKVWKEDYTPVEKNVKITADSPIQLDFVLAKEAVQNTGLKPVKPARKTAKPKKPQKN